MKHIINYSGGLGSAITAVEVAKIYGRDNTICVFADTLMEDEDLYRFNDCFFEKFGLEKVTLCYGKTPWELFKAEGFIANSRMDLCSRKLKRELLVNWMTSNFKPDECTAWVGIDYSEKHRIDRLQDAGKPYIYRAILAEHGVMLTREHKMAWCDANGMVPPRLYSMGFPHNNCGGFCVKAGLGQFKMLYELLPERYMQHEIKEQETINSKPGVLPFLRKTINNERYYLTMEEYRTLFLSTNKCADDVYDIGGCGCAL